VKAVDELAQNEDSFPRLIPVSKQTERRLLSVFMSLLDLVPVIRAEFLAMCGYGAGKTSSTQSFMEVSYSSPRLSDVRPDGLIACQRGSTKWQAFVEAKAEKKGIRPEQIADYAELAAALDVDAIITISNEFAFSPTELPYHLAAAKRRKRDIYHFAWADIRTFLEGFRNDEKLTPLERALLSECLRYFWEPGTGVLTYDSMPESWPKFVEAAGVALGFGTKTPGITEIVHGWQQERRDLCSKLTHMTGHDVRLRHLAGARATPEERLSHDRKALAGEYTLTAAYSIPKGKATLTTVTELQSRRINVTLDIPPPENKKARASVSWLISSTESDCWNCRNVLFDWKGHGEKQAHSIAALRDYPDVAFEGQKDAPKSIRIMHSLHDVRRFKSRKKFIEDVEEATTKMMQEALAAGLIAI